MELRDRAVVPTRDALDGLQAFDVPLQDAPMSPDSVIRRARSNWVGRNGRHRRPAILWFRQRWRAACRASRELAVDRRGSNTADSTSRRPGARCSSRSRCVGSSNCWRFRQRARARSSPGRLPRTSPRSRRRAMRFLRAPAGTPVLEDCSVHHRSLSSPARRHTQPYSRRWASSASDARG